MNPRFFIHSFLIPVFSSTLARGDAGAYHSLHAAQVTSLRPSKKAPGLETHNLLALR